MVVRIVLRVFLVAIALAYVLPHVSGLSFRGEWWAAFAASAVFNLVFWGLECLLAVVVVGVNIGTLGLGGVIAASLKFVATILSPVVALVSTSQMLPGCLKIVSYFPGALSGGLILGGLIWSCMPQKASKAS